MVGAKYYLAAAINIIVVIIVIVLFLIPSRKNGPCGSLELLPLLYPN